MGENDAFPALHISMLKLRLHQLNAVQQFMQVFILQKDCQENMSSIYYCQSDRKTKKTFHVIFVRFTLNL